jgi:hypothetical protein
MSKEELIKKIIQLQRKADRARRQYMMVFLTPFYLQRLLHSPEYVEPWMSHHNREKKRSFLRKKIKLRRTKFRSPDFKTSAQPLVIQQSLGGAWHKYFGY